MCEENTQTELSRHFLQQAFENKQRIVPDRKACFEPLRAEQGHKFRPNSSVIDFRTHIPIQLDPKMAF